MSNYWIPKRKKGVEGHLSNDLLYLTLVSQCNILPLRKISHADGGKGLLADLDFNNF